MGESRRIVRALSPTRFGSTAEDPQPRAWRIEKNPTSPLEAFRPGLREVGVQSTDAGGTRRRGGFREGSKATRMVVDGPQRPAVLHHGRQLQALVSPAAAEIEHGLSRLRREEVRRERRRFALRRPALRLACFDRMWKASVDRQEHRRYERRDFGGKAALGERRASLLDGVAQRVDAYASARGAIARLQDVDEAVAESLPPRAHDPRRVRVARAEIVVFIGKGVTRRRGRALALDSPQDGVDEARRSAVAEASREIDRLEDGGMLGDTAGEQQLVGTEEERFADRLRQRVKTFPHVRAQIPLEEAAHLHRAIGELGRQSEVTRIELSAARAEIEALLRASSRRSEDVPQNLQRQLARSIGFNRSGQGLRNRTNARGPCVRTRRPSWR